uniref:Uncharacterized protein n=1 Tax=Arundo donax TaxID=35708 RepID=A0A0A9B2A8_ARUDO
MDRCQADFANPCRTPPEGSSW